MDHADLLSFDILSVTIFLVLITGMAIVGLFRPN
jgi:hypothetical protein